jgi:glycosyltransferase 2 family protein
MKKIIQLFASFGLSGIFLWLAFRNIKGDELWTQLQNVNLFFVLLSFIAGVTTQIIRTYRFDILIRPFAKISRAALFRVSNLGMMLVLVLPLRLGEFARPYLLNKDAGAPMSSGIGAVVVERCLDGLLVTLLFFVAAAFLGHSYSIPLGVRTGAWIALLIFAGAMTVVVAALLTHGIVPRIVRKIAAPIAPKLTERLLAVLEAFVSGLRSLPNMRAVVGLTSTTLSIWIASALSMYWLMLGFGWHLPWLASVLLVSVVVVGVMIPAGPAFLGTYQSSLWIGLSIFGIGRTQAAAYGLISYPLTVLITVGFGLPYVFSKKFAMARKPSSYDIIPNPQITPFETSAKYE